MDRADIPVMNLHLMKKKKKKGLKGFFTKEIISISTDNMEHCAWYCSKCKKVLMWMDTDE